MHDHGSLFSFLDESPSPYHVVATAAARLSRAGFAACREIDDLGGIERGYVSRGGALVAWARSAPTPEPISAAFRIVGAHTDSPGFRIKPRPETGQEGWKQLGVEIYGGILANSWLDRDLGIAGRVVTVDGTTELLDWREPVARIAQLAIHLDRDVNERGLILDKQSHLRPIWGLGEVRPGEFSELIAARFGLGASDLQSWDLALVELTPASVLGADGSLIASGRLDNQLSCWAAVEALAGCDPGEFVAVVALFDHEEVGSDSDTGAGGALLERLLERLVIDRGGSRSEFLKAMAASTCVSADNAHAVHPNYPERHDPSHRPMVNAGPAIKVNANQRYATSAETAAAFARICRQAGVPVQSFVSRNNVPCGSTIGPITATRLGVATVDVGIPQLSMHSARELCGADDPDYLRRALMVYLAG